MNQDTMEYGLIGEHLSHSYSKEIHEHLADYTYDLLELTPQQVQDYMEKAPFKAINVTIPYKKTVMPYLQVMDETCRSVGSCNCIVNKNGTLYGYNTDYKGIDYTFERSHVDVRGKKVLLLGNGGVCSTYKAWLADHGAKEVLSVYYKPCLDTISYEEAYEKHPDAEILVNGTPCGMYPHPEGLPLDLKKFDHLEMVVDAIYNPFETRLLQQARKKGIKHANGLWMLVVQAIVASEHFTDTKYDPAVIESLWLSIIKERINVVLVGMPSCGKSSLAAMLQKATGKPLVELDAIIEEEIQMPISDYFAKYGEPAFRKVEKEILAREANRFGAILSCGGGVVLDPENVERLQANGLVVYVDRPVQLLHQQDATRPTLAKGAQALYEARKPLYEAARDITIQNDSSLQEAFEQLQEKLEDFESYRRFA